MPGYGVAEDDGGLLAWSWAEQRLAEAAESWLASVCPDGRPHVMPVWALWSEGAVWFSTGPGSRKARNLLAEPRCTVTTDDTRRPVIIEGVAELVTDDDAVERFATAVNAKYDSDYDVAFFRANHLFRVTPVRVFGLDEDAFTTSPTRWSFPPAPTPT
jgi:PPOX class probable F420-dependent enzyme